MIKVESKDQPVIIEIAGQRPYKPGLSMRRVLVACWGEYPAQWVGRSMTLYCDPEVDYGGVKVGGIRISHLSHIDGTHTVMLTAKRSRRKGFTVQPLKIASGYPADQFAANPPKWRAAIASGSMSAEDVITRACQRAPLSEEQKAAIKAKEKPATATNGEGDNNASQQQDYAAWESESGEVAK